MPKTEKSTEVLDKASNALVISFAQEHLRNFDRNCEIKEVFETGLHYVVMATRKGHQPVCIKFGKHSVQNPDETIPSIISEIKVFKNLKSEKLWVPSLLKVSADQTWFIREWLSGKSLDLMEGIVWDREMLRNLWNTFDFAFESFHTRDDPILLRDIYPRNIGIDGNRFFLFDFNSAKPLSLLHKIQIKSRLGTNFSKFQSPEHIAGDLSKLSVKSDYFGFASTMHSLIVGKVAWTNSEKGTLASRRTYEKEYNLASINLDEKMSAIGFSPMDKAFLMACMNPDPSRRPSKFQSCF